MIAICSHCCFFHVCIHPLLFHVAVLSFISNVRISVSTRWAPHSYYHFLFLWFCPIAIGTCVGYIILLVLQLVFFTDWSIQWTPWFIWYIPYVVLYYPIWCSRRGLILTTLLILSFCVGLTSQISWNVARAWWVLLPHLCCRYLFCYKISLGCCTWDSQSPAREGEKAAAGNVCGSRAGLLKDRCCTGDTASQRGWRLLSRAGSTEMQPDLRGDGKKEVSPTV